MLHWSCASTEAAASPGRPHSEPLVGCAFPADNLSLPCCVVGRGSVSTQDVVLVIPLDGDNPILLMPSEIMQHQKMIRHRRITGRGGLCIGLHVTGLMVSSSAIAGDMCPE